MYKTKIIMNDLGVMSLVIHARLGSQGVLLWSPWERDKVRNGSPHVTEGVRYTLARFSSVMYEIVLGVTPPGDLRKMNKDNDCLFNANLMNEWMNMIMYDTIW
jgi:hypothetical protein